MINKDYSCQINKGVIAKEKGKSTQIEMEKITHITCEGYLSSIHLTDREEPIKVSKLLKLYEGELLEFGFLRANNNTLVNTKNIVNLTKEENYNITLTSNKQIKISRRKLHLFKEFFEN